MRNVQIRRRNARKAATRHPPITKRAWSRHTFGAKASLTAVAACNSFSLPLLGAKVGCSVFWWAPCETPAATIAVTLTRSALAASATEIYNEPEELELETILDCALTREHTSGRELSTRPGGTLLRHMYVELLVSMIAAVFIDQVKITQGGKPFTEAASAACRKDTTTILRSFSSIGRE